MSKKKLFDIKIDYDNEPVLIAKGRDLKDIQGIARVIKKKFG